MFRQLNIRQRLALALWGAALLAFVLAGAGLALIQSLTLEHRARQIMEPYAQLVSVGTDAAVAFEDPLRAQEILDTLRANPQILEADIFLAGGRLLASFSRMRDAKSLALPAKPDGIYLKHGAAELLQGLPKGAHLRLIMGLEQLSEQTHQALWVFGAGVLVLLTVTLAQLAVLRRTIVRPITSLTETAELVRARADYSQRVPAFGTDEVARLGQSFNAMMEAVQERERDLREREARIRRLVDSNMIGILFCDTAGHVTEANDAFLRLIGYDREDLRDGRIDWQKITPPEHRAGYERSLAEIRRTGSCTPYEKEYFRKDGKRVSALVGGAMVDKATEQMLAFVLDLTERKQAEAEHHAREAAEAANRAKSEFLANMSHELRSPLNTILGFARLMREDPALHESARDDLALIMKSGEHLHALINQVLDLSKLEAGRFGLDETDFDLDLLLDDLKDMFTPAMVDKGLQFVFGPRQGVPRRVHADPLKLRQVLINLIGNALKFTDQGGVTVRVEARAKSGESCRLAFAVADTGVGIPPDDIGHLFTAFVQAKAGRQAQEGTGLGLAISRGFVRLMGGELQVDSEVGKGSTFGFDIPVRIVAESAAGTPSATRRRPVGLAPGEPRYRILVVDDHREARQLLLRLLRPLGFELQEAGNGQEAIERWRDWQPHLVWMDLRMPVLDGREAVRRIRAEARSLRPVIIAITASAFEEERAGILADGFDDFLSKPFLEEELFAALERHLRVRFIYREEAPPLPAPPLDPAALANLPEALRTSLEEALVHLDTVAVEQAIAAIEARDLRLARVLAAWASDFQYERILVLLQGRN